MFRFLLLLIIIIPAAEIGVLIIAGNVIGVFWTILFIVLTGVIGAWLAKKQGLETIKLVQNQMNNGYLPSEAILDGVCILVGAVLLLTPGFITDTVGFLLLIPKSRQFAKKIMLNLIKKWMKNGRYTIIR